MKLPSLRALTALLLLLSLFLTSCGRTEDKAADAIPPSDAAAVMQRVRETLPTVTSMVYNMELNMDLTLLDQPLPLTASMTGECLVSPMTMDTDMHVDMGQMGALDARLLLLREGDACALYMGMDAAGTGKLTWTRKTIHSPEALEQYNVQANMELYLQNADSFSYAGDEEINGISASRYDGVISQEALSQTLASNGMTALMKKLGIDDSAAVLDGLDSLSLSMWINPETYLPVRYEMDLSALTQNMLSGLLSSPLLTEGEGAGDLTAGQVRVSVTVSEYNSVETIQLPLEALSAAEL